MKRTHILTAAFSASMLLLAACGGGETETDTAQGALGDTGESPTSEPFEVRSIQIELGERSEPGQYGYATLTAVDRDTTYVVLRLYDGPKQPQLAHFHKGRCGYLGDTIYDIRMVEQGRSTSRVDASLEEIVDAGRRACGSQLDKQLERTHPVRPRQDERREAIE